MGIDDLKRLYHEMLRIRRVEERIAERYDEEKMKCPTHLSTGQEAVAVGVCDHLTREDIIFSTHRCHAHYLAKGGDLNRMIAEMYGKETGCAHGRGGSMHLIDVEAGMFGASAIVDGSLPLPVGVAWAFKLREQERVGVAFFGDAAVEPGGFHESLNFAAFHKLPVVFVCENNDYSTMTLRHERQHVPIAERAASYGMPGVRVDGNDIVEVYRVAGEAIARARTGEGPTLIEAVTYRWREHVEHNKGIMTRPRGEMLHWMARDPLRRCLEDMNVRRREEPYTFEEMEKWIATEIDDAFAFAEMSPSPKVEEILRGVGDELLDVAEPPRLDSGRVVSYASAIADATVQAMEHDEHVIVYGLHTTDLNGIFGTTKSAHDRFPGRVFDTPISEASLTAIGMGMALVGMRPLHVHARDDFMLVAMGPLMNELAKWSYMSGGQLHAPMVIRGIIGRSRGQGCQHSQSLQSIFGHFPGLHVVAPSNAFDAKGMLMTALSGNTPTIFLEHRLCHPMEAFVPEESYRVPFGKARIVREGSDVTIVALLQMVYEAEAAADQLKRHGVSAEVIDLRTIRPWDKETVLASVLKTGRLIVADTGWMDYGLSSEVTAHVCEHAFGALEAAPIRIALPACPTPMAEPLENAYYPGSREIVIRALRLAGREVPTDLRSDFATDGISGPF
jgi:TPP-dependent pyruvate/acetoin dehydrogenase alpha subunit/pyruvate/2-oxoglutarate/acetoin dehydrogenase E1 component